MDSFKQLYAGQCLYAVLNVDKAADAAQIKKAYFKKALQWVGGGAARRPGRRRPARAARASLTATPTTPPPPACAQHPDKNADDPTATQRFQALSWAHSLLGDAGKRKVYDETVRCAPARCTSTAAPTGTAAILLHVAT